MTSVLLITLLESRKISFGGAHFLARRRRDATARMTTIWKPDLKKLRELIAQEEAAEEAYAETEAETEGRGRD